MQHGDDLPTVKTSYAALTNNWGDNIIVSRRSGGAYQMLENLSANRVGVIAIAILFVGIVIALMATSWTSAKSAKNVTLIYVGAENCAPCEIWQHNQGTAFRDSTKFRRLTYREVKTPSLLDVLKDENWPEDLRIYRQAISRGAGVPLWLVIADDQLVMQSFGLTQWQAAVLPKIKSLLR